jgi:tape measure domain-containing protein
MASSLLIRIGADLSGLGQSLTQAENRLKRFSFKAERVGRELTTRVSLPILAIGVTAVKTFADFDRLEKGLAALSGGAAGGAAAFNRLNAIVLDTRTTLDLKTAALGEQRLVGAGLAAAEAERTIKQLGIAATVSGSSIDDVGGVLRQFTQIIGKGKVEQEDLNSILDRMPALGALITAEFGGSTAEAIRDTGISMEDFVSRLITSIEVNKDFQNVQGGLAKSFESFGNAVQVGIRPLGEAIAKTLNLEVNLAKLGAFVTKTAQAFADLNPNLQKFIIFAALGAATMGPLTLVLGAAARSLPLLTSGFSLLLGPLAKLGPVAKVTISAFAQLGSGSIVQRVLGFVGVFAKSLGGLKAALAVLVSPVGLIVAGIALLVAGFVAAYRNSEFFRDQISRLGSAFGELFAPIRALVSGLFPSLSGAFGSVGDVFKVVFAVIGGAISFVIEGFISLVETINLVAGAISDIFSGNFSDAADKLSRSLLNPQRFGIAALESANAAVTVFSQTVRKGFDRIAASQEVRDFAGLLGGFAANQDSVLPSGIAAPSKTVSTVKKTLPETPEILKDYAAAVAAITEKQKLYGESFDGVNAKAELATQTIGRLIENGYKSQGSAVQGVISDLKGLRSENVAVSNVASGLLADLIKGQSNPLDFGAKAAAASAKKIEDSIKALKPVIQEDIFSDYRNGLKIITEKQDAFGGTYDALAAKINLTKSAINSLVEDGYPAQIGAVELLTTQLAALTEAQKLQNAETDISNEKLAITKNVYESLGISFERMAEKLTNGQKAATLAMGVIANIATSAFDKVAQGTAKLGDALLQSTREIIGSFIKLGVAAVVSGALVSSSFLGPLAIPIGAAAGAGANALFQELLTSLNVPALATGGIATGPQLALIGEAGPEAVVPLDKLQNMIDMGGGRSNGGGEVVFRISGNELIGILERAQPNYNRS